MIISGYPIVFDSLSVDLGGFVERVQPQAVDRSLRGSGDIVGLYNHDSGKVIGRRSAQTLELAKDSHGLGVAVDVDETISFGRDLARVIARGDARGGSFGFRVLDDAWSLDRSGRVLRDLLDIEIFEVSLGVSFPAYPATHFQIAQRSAQSSTRPSTIAFKEKQLELARKRTDTRLRLAR